MRRIRSGLLVHAMWGVGGLTVGATAALLLARGFKPDWLEATGTWVGGIATVLALLWAVQTFRADQDARQVEKLQAEQDRAAEFQAVNDAVLAEASRVSLELRGGGGYGGPNEQKMNSVHLNIHNEADHVAIIDDISLHPPLKPTRMPRLPIRVAPKSSWTDLLDMEVIDADPSEMSDKPVPRFSGTVAFRLDGRDWTRDTNDRSRPA